MRGMRKGAVSKVSGIITVEENALVSVILWGRGSFGSIVECASMKESLGNRSCNTESNGPLKDLLSECYLPVY